MVLAEGGVGRAGMEKVVVVVDGKNEKAMPLAEAAKRVRRGAEVWRWTLWTLWTLVCFRWLREGGRRGGSAARCCELVDADG